jgi:hypothetical protein
VSYAAGLRVEPTQLARALRRVPDAAVARGGDIVRPRARRDEVLAHLAAARPECTLAFYDATRSATQRWHAERPCGLRERQRRHRAKHAA